VILSQGKVKRKDYHSQCSDFKRGERETERLLQFAKWFKERGRWNGKIITYSVVIATPSTHQPIEIDRIPYRVLDLFKRTI